MERRSNIFVTVDMCVFRRHENMTWILLVERAHDPFAGSWALPGGFVEQDEDLEPAARRELAEETGLEVGPAEQLGAFGKPGRDPRQRTVSVVFIAWANGRHEVTAGDDAAKAEWFALADLPQLAFDHMEIVAAAREKIGV